MINRRITIVVDFSFTEAQYGQFRHMFTLIDWAAGAVLACCKFTKAEVRKKLDEAI